MPGLPRVQLNVTLEAVVLSRLISFLPLSFSLPAEIPSKLSVVQPVLQEYEDGPSISPAFRFHAGDRVFLTFRIAGFQVAPGEEKRLRLKYTLHPEDDSGAPLEPSLAGAVETTLAAEDKDWTPKVSFAFSIPQLADPGSYRVRIAVKDELSGAEAESAVTFAVRGRTVEASENLTIRNFRFLRSDEDAPSGLDPPIYPPGSLVHARFEITGYKFAEKNRFSVEYGLEVLNPEGERIFEQPRAAGERQESFYRKRYMESSLQLGFKPPLPPGAYTVVIAVRDLIGTQTHESRFPFRVE